MSMNLEAADLTLVKNQNELSIQLSLFFNLKELLILDLDSITLNNNNSKTKIIYEKKFKEEDGTFKTFTILDIKMESSIKISSNRYIFIRIIDDNYQIDFKYRYSKSIIKYIALSIKKSINFINFRNPDDNIIIKKNIIDNAAKKLATKYDLNTLEEINFIIYDVTSKSELLENGFEYSKKLDNRTTVAIDTMKYFIVFGLYDSENKKFPFLFLVDKRLVGLSQLCMISEESIAYKNKMRSS